MDSTKSHEAEADLCLVKVKDMVVERGEKDEEVVRDAGKRAWRDGRA